MQISGQFQAMAVEMNFNYPVNWRVVGTEPVLDIWSKKNHTHSKNRTMIPHLCGPWPNHYTDNIILSMIILLVLIVAYLK